ncbi:hypothetical protein [Chamaesiphon sp. GL140_3_metabinner_50]|nr:hypothetical protein [Chamaesiphon sp. GL140_3_metabinner_50]
MSASIVAHFRASHRDTFPILGQSVDRSSLTIDPTQPIATTNLYPANLKM